MEYLYEMHAHSKEVSVCSITYAKEMAKRYADKGYDGIVITDHMNAPTFKKVGLEDAPWDKKIDHYLTGFNALKEAAEGRFNVLLGMEINFYNHPNDYLVYGITEDFLRSNGDIMAMTPAQFSKLAHENGLLMIQAHPFRRGMKIENWQILDGYEVFNGNPRHRSSNETAVQWAKLHGKTLVTSGSDFHEPEDTGIGGIYFQKPIETNADLLEELRAENYRLKVTEIQYTRPE